MHNKQRNEIHVAKRRVRMCKFSSGFQVSKVEIIALQNDYELKRTKQIITGRRARSGSRLRFLMQKLRHDSQTSTAYCFVYYRFTQTKRDFELKALEGFDPKVYNKEWQDKEWKEYSKI